MVLSIPGLQFFTGIVKLKPLHGVVNEPHIVPLTFDSYLDFEYQESVLKYIDFHFGFRPFFIRLYNQIEFSMFHTPNATGVTIGKQGYLYERWFIQDYMGFLFVGNPKIEQTVSQLSDIRKYLKKYNTELLVILAPGKGWYYPEYIPDYLYTERKISNYQAYAGEFQKSDIPLFDANAWFMELKNKQPYPLFTKMGTHWSEYGAKIAADSLIRRCEVLLNRKMNKIHITDVEWSNEPRTTDNDLEKLLNLFFPLPQLPMAYPTYEKEDSVPMEKRPSVIVIGDSFYWNMYDGVLGNSFKTNQYWYYFNSIFPQYGNSPETVQDIDMFEALSQTDLFILITSTSGLYKMGDGFIDAAWELANNEKGTRKKYLMKKFTKAFLNSDEMMQLLTEKALKRNISLDSMIYLDANYLADKALEKQSKP